MGATLTRKIRIRPLSVALRLAVLLMVIGMGGCDNVEWGGIDIAIVRPPSEADEGARTPVPSALPTGPVLFYVHRDSTGATVVPVGQIEDDDLVPIDPSDDPEAFGARFIGAFLTPGTELALFHRAQRVGTLTVDSAGVPAGPVCRPLPRATGSAQLNSTSGAVTEFLALASAAAPESQSSGQIRPGSSMRVVGDMLAREILGRRGVRVASASPLRQQLVPFPLAGTADPAFAATYLVDDTLGPGGDTRGDALFVVFTPQGQTGYDTAFVGFTDYAEGGKAAPRVIDFLDWDGDGNVELLLEVFGVRTSWFRAVGRTDDHWRGIFQDRCDPRTAPMEPDTVPAPPANGETATPTPRRRARAPSPALDSIPIIEPDIRLSNPGANPRVARDTMPPDSGGGV